MLPLSGKFLITQRRGVAKGLCRSISRGGRYHSCRDTESATPTPYLCKNRHAILRDLYHRAYQLKALRFGGSA